jgi:hypothetical protein
MVVIEMTLPRRIRLALQIALIAVFVLGFIVGERTGRADE